MAQHTTGLRPSWKSWCWCWGGAWQAGLRRGRWRLVAASGALWAAAQRCCAAGVSADVETPGSMCAPVM